MPNRRGLLPEFAFLLGFNVTLAAALLSQDNGKWRNMLEKPHIAPVTQGIEYWIPYEIPFSSWIVLWQHPAGQNHVPEFDRQEAFRLYL
jgi:hypothetical protein